MARHLHTTRSTSSDGAAQDVLIRNVRDRKPATGT